MKAKPLPDRPKARLSDIAREADVSIGTVSRVLNGKSDVDPSLAERVLSTAQQLGYSKRAPLSNSPTSAAKTGVIGYLVDAPSIANVTGDPFMQQFLGGVETGVNNKGGHLLFATCAEEVTRDTLPAMVVEKRVQGVIFKNSQRTPDAWLRKLAASVPTVMLMSSCEDRSIHSVMCDNHAGTYQIMRYLRDLGHRRIGFLTVEDVGLPHSVLHIERLEAYRNYMHLLGCEPHPAYVQIPRRDHARETLAQAVDKGLKAFMALGSERPTALVCATDIYAATVLNLAPRHGLEVPRDLSVAGFMNSDICEHSIPPLTSVSLSGDEVGRIAVNLLLERLETPDLMVRHVSVGTRLVERLSCARVAPRSSATA